MSGGFSCCPDLTENDTVIVCGDLGLLWTKGESFEQDCEFFAKQSFTLLWVQGNHENYNMIDEYPVEKWHGGKVRHIVRDKVILLERGQVFDIEGKRYFFNAFCQLAKNRFVGKTYFVDAEGKMVTNTWILSQ